MSGGGETTDRSTSDTVTTASVNDQGERGWIALFSGGKDSSLALYRALERGLDVRRLLIVHPVDDSYMFHVPETELATLAAESIGIPSIDVEPSSFQASDAVDSATQGEKELAVLEEAIESTMAAVDWDLVGVIAGAIESEFQTSRIESMCDRLDCDLFSPLWQEDHDAIAAELVDTGFETIIVQVGAAGLDETWLGRTLDTTAFEELESLQTEYGIHLLGEGGEFETMVVDGPHMDRRIELDYDVDWEGTRGRIRVHSATLE